MRPSCVTPLTPVGGSLVVAVRAFYTGALVTLSFASGCDPLTITPGTPVATRAGFVRAGDLAVGAHVLRVTGTTPDPTASDSYFALHADAKANDREAIPTDAFGDGEHMDTVRHVYPMRAPLRVGRAAALDVVSATDPWAHADRGKTFVELLAHSCESACAWDVVMDVRVIERAAHDPHDGCYVYDFVSPRRWYCAAGVVVANSVADPVAVTSAAEVT
jgi:hypothetical protein